MPLQRYERRRIPGALSRARQRGNVAILVALAAVPLVGIVALAVDFGMASLVKNRLDLAADSAALVGATAAANSYKAGANDAPAQGVAAARGRFDALSASQNGAVIASPSVSVTQQGGLFQSNIAYTAEVPTGFARVLGIDTLPVAGGSVASLSLNPFVDVQILMDVSSSMLIAATPADTATLESLTANFVPNGPLPGNVAPHESCSFACHWSSTYEDYYQLALDNHVQLRLTVLQQAVGQLIGTIGSMDTNNRFELGLYTFSQSLSAIYPLSHDIGGAAVSLRGIAPDINQCDANCPDTYFTTAMQGMDTIDAALPRQGANVPQRFLFIVTDGVFDDYVGGNREIGPFNPADCTALKALGVGILVLYTPYLPIPENGYYVAHVAPISDQIVPDLQACTSAPGYFFVASDSSQIATQLQTMFQLIVRSSSHLTQ